MKTASTTNFIILCVDCFRFDCVKEHLHFMPNLSTQIQQKTAFLFENTYATAPWTFPSTNSILTGLYPHHHGARHYGTYRPRVYKPWPARLDPTVPTLFSVLKEQGYRTLGVSTIFWSLNPQCSYRGCDTLRQSIEHETFHENTEAKQVIKSFQDTYRSHLRGKPFFAYLHLIDLHRPFRLEIARHYCEEDVEIMEGIDEWYVYPYLNDPNALQRFKINKMKLYKALLKYVDEQIQYLLSFLENQGILEQTLVIVVGDHGEEFFDHYEDEKIYYDCGKKTSENFWLLGTGHGHTLFNELVHIPLILFHTAFSDQTLNVDKLLSHVDIYPTILQLLDLQPSHRIDGESLFVENPDREILAESTLYGFERKALIRNSLKCIYSPGDIGYVFYDLKEDPNEKKPILDIIDSQIVSKLEKLYHESTSTSKSYEAICPFTAKGKDRLEI